VKFEHYILKRKIENIFIAPFVWIGQSIAIIFPLKKDYEIFLFFPFYHTGGAEKIHLQIAQAIHTKKVIIFFTKKSKDNRFFNDFQNTGITIKNISTFTDNKWFYFLNLIFRGIIAKYIHSQKKAPIVFNGQCNFAYKISPWISPSIKQIELIHSMNSFSWIRIPFIPFYQKTIMISKIRIEDHYRQYLKISVPEVYKNNIQWIINGTETNIDFSKKLTNTLNILYVGRGTIEKRVHIVAAIAEKVKQHNLPIKFYFIGDVENAIPAHLKCYCNFLGNITDNKQIQQHFANSHITLITSNTEGFPLVIAEAMMYKNVIAATGVGDIPYHLKNTNNLIFSDSENEEIIINEAAEFIIHLFKNNNEVISIGNKNREYALEHFNINNFNKQYLEIFNE
jgi:glycosyltransferase involved in cell wall biosynthesis